MEHVKRDSLIKEKEQKVEELVNNFSEFEQKAHSHELLSDYSFVNQVNYTKDLINLFKEDLKVAKESNDFKKSMVLIDDSWRKLEASFEEIKLLLPS